MVGLLNQILMLVTRGECDPGLARALTGFFAGTVPGGDSDVPPSGIEEVVSALRLARVLIPCSRKPATRP